METFFDYKNILHWALIASPVAAFFLVWIGIKKLRLQQKGPENLNIKEISAKPWTNDGYGSYSQICNIVFTITNPNDSDNEINVVLRPIKSAEILATKNGVALLAKKTTRVELQLDHKGFNTEKSVSKYRGKRLLLQITDIVGKKIKHVFIFKDKN